MTNLHWDEPDFTFSKCVLRSHCHDWKHHSWSCTLILRVCQLKVVLLAGCGGLWLPCFLCLLLTYLDCCASVSLHWFSQEWSVITAAGCVCQVHWRTGSSAFCVISCASDVSRNAFFYRRRHWLSELAASSALNAVPLGSCTTSGVFIITQLGCWGWVWYKLFLQEVRCWRSLHKIVQRLNRELNAGLKCLWAKWTVGQDHLIAAENWDTGWWSMKFWEGEQRALDLCRPDLPNPYPKLP